MTKENIKKELLKKKASLILAGTMTLTSFAGCNAKLILLIHKLQLLLQQQLSKLQ